MSAGFLVVRRGGALWGLPADQVATIERTAAGPGTAPASPAGTLDVCFADGRRLPVDAVLTLAGDLAPRPLSARLRRLLPPGAAGLAMLAGEPLVVLAREVEIVHV